MLTIVAGIRPRSAGFDGVVIEPHLGKLQHVEAVLPTLKGMVEVKYRRLLNGVEARITLPEGMMGVLVWNGNEQVLRPGEQTVILR